MVEGEGWEVNEVSDSRVGVYNAKGLAISALLEHKSRTGTVVGYREAEAIDNQRLLELECEVLIPAALENQITENNAARIRARIVAEAANGPTTPEADDILFNHGVFVIPDILSNAGGGTVAHFEWDQDLPASFWDPESI